MNRRLFSALALLTLAAAPLHAQDGKVEAGGLTFTYSAPWKMSDTPGMMRAATLLATVDGVEKPLEAAFYFFPGGGGGVQANVDRWLGQFAKTDSSKTEELDAGGKKVTLVSASGTYNDGPPMGAKTPKENFSLLGAIVPTPDSNVFIKLTGPKDAVARLAESFKKMALSAYVK
ncbi:MAG: hypothetical protein HS117_26670 [Verrucomicrobiaceae bacterium]|jgi:hypothetical protein|nr:hypothetical protein [Verrucomicrobiaceae bacterium]